MSKFVKKSVENTTQFMANNESAPKTTQSEYAQVQSISIEELWNNLQSQIQTNDAIEQVIEDWKEYFSPPEFIPDSLPALDIGTGEWQKTSIVFNEWIIRYKLTMLVGNFSSGKSFILSRLLDPDGSMKKKLGLTLDVLKEHPIQDKLSKAGKEQYDHRLDINSERLLQVVDSLQRNLTPLPTLYINGTQPKAWALMEHSPFLYSIDNGKPAKEWYPALWLLYDFMDEANESFQGVQQWVLEHIRMLVIQLPGDLHWAPDHVFLEYPGFGDDSSKITPEKTLETLKWTENYHNLAICINAEQNRGSIDDQNIREIIWPKLFQFFKKGRSGNLFFIFNQISEYTNEIQERIHGQFQQAETRYKDILNATPMHCIQLPKIPLQDETDISNLEINEPKFLEQLQTLSQILKTEPSKPIFYITDHTFILPIYKEVVSFVNKFTLLNINHEINKDNLVNIFLRQIKSSIASFPKYPALTNQKIISWKLDRNAYIILRFQLEFMYNLVRLSEKIQKKWDTLAQEKMNTDTENEFSDLADSLPQEMENTMFDFIRHEENLVRSYFKQKLESLLPIMAIEEKVVKDDLLT